MERDAELALGDRLWKMVSTGPLPADQTFSTVDVSVYTDIDRHRRELALFAASPMPAVAASEIPQPGDFVTVELGGAAIIVTRGRDGIVHALHNACAHRGATVETRPSGSARVLSCGFHGWSYELDGTLRSVADAELFSTAPCTGGLRPVGCEERHGMVWVTVASDSGVGQSEEGPTDSAVVGWLGSDIDQLFTELGLGGMVHHQTTEFDLDCNWKLLTDGFLEIYHLKYLHRNSIAPFFPANLTCTEQIGDHFVGWLPKNRLVAEMAERPRDEWRVLSGVTGATVLVPGTVVQWQAGHVELFSLRPDPVDPGHCTARLTMLVPGDRAGETELWDRNWARVCDTIPGEDFAAAVDVQRNINSGAVTEIRLGANEHFIADHLAAVGRNLASR